MAENNDTDTDAGSGTPKRPRGILTHSDRKFLRGEMEYAHRQTASERRRDVRIRVHNALKDFELLHEHWSDDELETVAGRETDAPIALLYRLAGLGEWASPQDAFSQLLTEGIFREYRRERNQQESITISPPNVTFEVEEGEALQLEEIHRKVRGEGYAALSDNELLCLIWMSQHRQSAGFDFGEDLDETLEEIAERVASDWDIVASLSLSAEGHGDFEKAPKLTLSDPDDEDADDADE